MTYLRSTGVSASASTTRFNLLGKVPAGAAALMLGVSTAAMMSGSAQALCIPGATGGNDNVICGILAPDAGFDALAGDDTLLIIDPLAGNHTGIFTGNSGNDIITLDNTTGLVPTVILGTIDGGADNDTINLLSGILGTSVTNVTGGTGDDTITLDGATVTDNIDAGDGNDFILLNSGSVGTVPGGGEDVIGGAGNDIIVLNGATLVDDIRGGDGDDTINVLSGSLDDIFAQGGNDSIFMSGGAVGDDILGGDGDDFIQMTGGTVTGSVLGEANNDTLWIDGGSVGGSVLGGDGNDSIELGFNGPAATVTGNIDGESGDDSILMWDGTVTNVLGGTGNDSITILDGTVGNNVEGNDGDDTINLLGGTVTGAILGDTVVGGFQGNDTINLLAGSAGSVNGQAGNDTITLNGASITGNLSGGNDEDIIVLLSGTVGGNVFSDDHDDTVTLDGATIVGNINSGGGSDTIFLLSGSVTNVEGNVGSESITLNGATVTGNIDGGSGSETIALLGGTVVNVLGGISSDTITLDGAAVSGDISGGSESDTITLLAGSAFNALGDAGDDMITLNGASITNNIGGGAGEDTIDLLAGTAAAVFGGDQNDTIMLAGAAIAGSIDGNADNDTININSGTVGGDVLGSAGEDLITVNGGVITGSVGGGGENDVINLNGGTVGDSVFGGVSGDDTINLNGSLVTNDLAGGTDDDVFVLTTGSFGRDLLGGLGSDTATIELTYSLASIAGLLDGGDDVSAADGFVDTLNIQASGSLTGNNIINWENININAGNTVVLGGTGLTTGADGSGGLRMAVINSSTLDFDDGFALTGDLSVFTGSTLIADDGAGVYSISGYFLMDGVLDMSDGIGPNDVLTVGGPYDVLGGDLLMDVALDATEQGDLLVLNNTLVFGPTEITFTDTNPLGAPSFTGTGPGNGIPIVDNSAFGAISDGDFIFDPVAHPTNEILKVPFVYMLSLESDDILYLQSDVLAQVYGYAILAELMREDFPILRERLGDKRYNGFSGDGTDNDGAAGGGVGWDNGGIWARIEGTKRTNEHRGDFTTGEWEASRIEAEVGIDIPMNVGGGQGLFGISTHFIQGFADANSGLTPDPDVAEVDTTGFGAGLSFVYFPGGGFYADVQGRFTAWDADVEVDNRSIDQDINALGWGASLEVGNRIAFGNTAVTPRGRAIYSDVSFESFTDDDGVKVKQEDSASVVVEGGVTVEQMFPDNGVTIFADASVSHDVLRDSAIDASGFTFDSGLVDTWGTVAIGGSMETGQGTSAFIAAEVSSPFGTTFGNSIGYGLRAGVRVDF